MRRLSTTGRVGVSGPWSASTIQTYLRHVLDGLALTPPIDPDELCARIGDRRGRRIELVARALPPDTTSGLLISYKTKELIVYQADTTPAHQRHIVFHEILHLLRGHLDDDRESAICGALLGTSNGESEDSLYGDRQEWEAETGATILSGWSSAASSAQAPTEEAQRLGSVFGGGEWL